MGNKTIEDILDFIKTVSEKCDLIREYIQEVRKDLTSEIEKNNLQYLNLKEQNLLLKAKVNNLEQKLKKYNLVIYGLQEKDNEIDDIQQFFDIITKKLEISCRFDHLRDFYSFGDKQVGKNRSISIELVSYKLKIEYSKRRSYLKVPKHLSCKRLHCRRISQTKISSSKFIKS